MMYDNGKTFVLAQSQGKELKHQQAREKQKQREKRGVWVEVADGTRKLMKKGLSANNARKKYELHRDNWYEREGLRRLK